MRWVCVCMCICVILMHLIGTHTLMNILGGISTANRQLSSQTKLNYLVGNWVFIMEMERMNLVSCVHTNKKKLQIKCKFHKCVVADWDRYCASFEESLTYDWMSVISAANKLACLRVLWFSVSRSLSLSLFSLIMEYILHRSIVNETWMGIMLLMGISKINESKRARAVCVVWSGFVIHRRASQKQSEIICHTLPVILHAGTHKNEHIHTPQYDTPHLKLMRNCCRIQ